MTNTVIRYSLIAGALDHMVQNFARAHRPEAIGYLITDYRYPFVNKRLIEDRLPDHHLITDYQLTSRRY